MKDEGRKIRSRALKVSALAVRWLLAFFILHPSSFILPSAVAAADPDWHELVATGQLVDLRRVDATIVIGLRYATANNCVGVPLYPPDFPCLVRPETAVALHLAEQKLATWGYRLKIWDAYRPLTAHQKLWQKWARRGYVANPDVGPGSLHSWGVAVDATLVDDFGREVLMPSDFDVFKPEAGAVYQGNDPKAKFHVHLLQAAMGDSGFFGLTTEWWHFALRDWEKFKPLSAEASASSQKPTPAASAR